MVLQAFVSEYAVWKEDAANGSLLAAVAEAAFLIGVEKNRFSIAFFYCILFPFYEANLNHTMFFIYIIFLMQ